MCFVLVCCQDVFDIVEDGIGGVVYVEQVCICVYVMLVIGVEFGWFGVMVDVVGGGC